MSDNPTTARTITGKIIRILDKQTVIINIGARHGVRTDNIFKIIGEAERIIDPDTGENLGAVSIVKTRIKASQVFDKFTIATTKWTEIRSSLSFALEAFRTVPNELVQTIDEGDLMVNPEEILPWKAKSETPVRVGDIVETNITVSEDESAPDAQEATKQP